MNRMYDPYKHMKDKIDEYLANMNLSQEMRSLSMLSMNKSREVRDEKKLTKVRPMVVKPFDPIWRKSVEFFPEYSSFAIIPVIKTVYQNVSKHHFMFGISEPKNTYQNIMKILKNNGKSDVRIMSEEFNLSLICPISAKRIEFPARFDECKHIECFDLENLLTLNFGKTHISCPICLSSNRFPLRTRGMNPEIKIDGFLYRILSSIEISCNSIIFNKSGQWRKGNADFENKNISSIQWNKSVNTKPNKSKIEIIYID